VAKSKRKRFEAGLCVNCGKRERRSCYRTCEVCAAVNKDRIRDRLKKLKMLGLCSVCGSNKRVRGRGRCSRCADVYAGHARRYQQQKKLTVLTHYSGSPPKCQCCGERVIQFLTIDHVNNDGHAHRRAGFAGGALYGWIIGNNFPSGFQVMCWNCNCGKSVNMGVCPHASN
jgi:hypothetical protein